GRTGHSTSLILLVASLDSSIADQRNLNAYHRTSVAKGGSRPGSRQGEDLTAFTASVVPLEPSSPSARGKLHETDCAGRKSARRTVPRFHSSDCPSFPLPLRYAFRILSREMAERMISDVLAKPDAALEMTLRPSLFSEFTGQAKVKERLEIAVAAARQRGEALDHILLSGPPGLGKPTPAYMLSRSMGTNLKATS